MRALASLLIAGSLAVGACGSDEPATPLTISGGETGAEMWFDPPHPDVAPGRYDITFDNVGAAHHELAVVSPSGDVLAARSIAGGTATTIEVDLSEPGLYQLQCREPGHTEAGMVGTMTVG